jgi:hypothetical protein
MPYSFPNQKWIQVHKPRVTERFLQISHEDWMQANKTLSPYGLQLYLYLASNNDNYKDRQCSSDWRCESDMR